MSDDDGRRARDREDRDNAAGVEEEIPEEERAPLRNRPRQDDRDQGRRADNNAVLEIRTYFEERFNQLLTSTRRTQRQLSEHEAMRKPLKYPGNEMQVAFNTKILSSITEVRDLLRENEGREAEEKLRGIEKKITDRVKLIRLADRSPGGWETVKEYEDDDLADNSADEKKIRKAETRALAKKKKKDSSSSSRFHPYEGAKESTSNEATSNTRFRNAPRRDSAPSTQVTGNSVRTGLRANAPAGQQVGGVPSYSTYGQGQCYGCGGFGHWRRHCPKINAAKTATSTAPSSP